MTTKLAGRDRARLERSLNRLVSGLVAKEFTFVMPAASPEQLQRQLVKYDDRRVALSQEIFGLVIDLTTVPEFLKVITAHVVGFGTQKADDRELAALQRLMRESFPLCAVAFSRLYGPRFVALLHGETITYQEYVRALNRFEQITNNMMPLGGRLTLKLLGRDVAGINSSAATGSLIVLASSPARAELLRQWAKRRPVRSDTILNQLKARVRSKKFWVKAAFGMVEYQPHQLRQEVVVLDLSTGRATSSVSPPRIGVEFGFSLRDIGGA
jgi:hypothetical protein